MKNPKKVLGIFTFLCGLPPILAAIGVLILPEVKESAVSAIGGFTWNLVTISLIATFVVRGVGGIIGGVLLFRGAIKGYYLSSVVWSYLLLTNLYTGVSLALAGGSEGLSMINSSAIFSNVIVVAVSILILVSLYKGFNVIEKNSGIPDDGNLA